MAHSTQHSFPTHEDCANFRDGICTMSGVAVDGGGPVCPNFTPKSVVTMQQEISASSRAKRSYRPYVPLIQGHPPYMLTHSSSITYNLPPQIVYSYRTRHTTGRAPSVPTTHREDDLIFLSMSVGRRGRGRGRMGRSGAGSGGFCVCPRCGYTAPHTIRNPCYQQTCQKCGNRMTRGR